MPDVVVAHPGWGEALFVKDVFPEARLVVYAEYFYGGEGGDIGFDPEFSQTSLTAQERMQRDGLAHLKQAARKTIVERYDLQTHCLPAQIELLEGLI